MGEGRFDTLVASVGTAAPRLPEFAFLPPGVSVAGRFRGLAVVIFGCGAVGRAIAEGVVRLGLGRIDLVDPDRYSEANVGSQPISPSEVGRPKARSTAEKLRGICPATEIRVFDGRAEELRDDVLADCDVAFVATDNLKAEQEIARRCVEFGVPLIQGSVYGTMLVAQVRLLLHGPGDPPCLVCGYTDADFEHAANETKFSCAGVVAGERPDVVTMPTMSIAALSAFAANLAVVLLVRLVLELGDRLEDCLVEFSGYAGGCVTSRLERNAACPAAHTRFSRVAYDGDLAGATLREIGTAAGFDVARSRGAMSIRVDEYDFAPFATCGCPKPSALNRYVGPGAPVRRCRRCGQDFAADPFSRRRQVGVGLVERWLDRPLRSLGAGDVGYAVVRNADRTVFLANGEAKEKIA